MTENSEYLGTQLITCLGNKRALLDFIGQGIGIVKKRLDRDKLALFDVFSGSGIVARYFRQFSDFLIVNDLEKYSGITNECYLSDKDELDMPLLRQYYNELIAQAKKNPKPGIISQLYAPKDDSCIQAGERVFYTASNALYIDTIRQLIAGLPRSVQKFFLAPLLSEASIHVNTSGVFKGFYKNEAGVGQFGGRNKNALSRITGSINLPFPVFSNFNCETMIFSEDSNNLIGSLPPVDAAYIDPPYNQHPYGSNYFMLNIITDYIAPQNISKVSGIPAGWNRSDYNYEKKALPALTCLVKNINAKFILISFNSEGFISLEQMTAMLKKIGKLETLETGYNTFRGSRNLAGRGIYVKEYLFILEK